MREKYLPQFAGTVSTQRGAGQGSDWEMALWCSQIDAASNQPYRDFPIQPDMLAQY